MNFLVESTTHKDTHTHSLYSNKKVVREFKNYRITGDNPHSVYDTFLRPGRARINEIHRLSSNHASSETCFAPKAYCK